MTHGQHALNTVNEYAAIIVYRFVQWDKLPRAIQLGFEQFAEAISVPAVDGFLAALHDQNDVIDALRAENATLQSQVTLLQATGKLDRDAAALMEVYKDAARHWRRHAELLVKEFSKKD